MNPINQAEVDQKMKDLDGTDNKAKLGANAILAVSLAVAKVGRRGGQRPHACTSHMTVRKHWAPACGLVSRFWSRPALLCVVLVQLKPQGWTSPGLLT